MVKHPTHHHKVEGLSPAIAAAGTGSGQLGTMTRQHNDIQHNNTEHNGYQVMLC